MAKRKRLSPANPHYIDADTPPEADPGDVRPLGRRPARAPIAEIAGETASAAALGELSRSVEAARAAGRMILALPLEAVEAEHLVRDRLGAEDEELFALMESLATRGQQTPVEVVDRGAEAEPRYGLISGWRRLGALRRLAAEDRGPNEVLAVIRAPKAASDAYIAMVEENEIRVGLSYYERARIVVKSVEAGVFEDREAALRALFGAVSRAKRSKIRSFTEIVSALDGALSFPTRLAERGGLELARRLSDDPDLAARLRADLAAAPPESAEAELARLSGPRRAARPATPDPETAPPDTAVPPAPADPPRVVTAYNPERGEITLSGPGVTAALRAALDRWLADRG